MIEFSITMPPTANNMFFNVKGRGRVRTSEYAAWRDANAWLIRKLRLAAIDGDVRVDIDLPVNRRRDIDNSIKPILDCIEAAGIVKNDRQIRALWVAESDRLDVSVRVEVL